MHTYPLPRPPLPLRFEKALGSVGAVGGGRTGAEISLSKRSSSSRVWAKSSIYLVAGCFLVRMIPGRRGRRLRCRLPVFSG